MLTSEEISTGSKRKRLVLISYYKCNTATHINKHIDMNN